MIEKGSMFKAWEATTEQQKKAHEMQAIYKAQETARQAIQEAMNRYIKKKDPRPQRGESRSRPVRGTGRMGKP